MASGTPNRRTPMPPARKPDALTPAERQRRYLRRNGLHTLRVTSEVMTWLARAQDLSTEPRSPILVKGLQMFCTAQNEETAIIPPSVTAVNRKASAGPSSRERPSLSASDPDQPQLFDEGEMERKAGPTIHRRGEI